MKTCKNNIKNTIRGENVPINEGVLQGPILSSIFFNNFIEDPMKKKYLERTCGLEKNQLKCQ